MDGFSNVGNNLIEAKLGYDWQAITLTWSLMGNVILDCAQYGSITYKFIFIE